MYNNYYNHCYEVLLWWNVVYRYTSGILKPWPRTITFTTFISQKRVFLIIKISSMQIFPFKDFDAKDHMTHHLFKG